MQLMFGVSFGMKGHAGNASTEKHEHQGPIAMPLKTRTPVSSMGQRLKYTRFARYCHGLLYTIAVPCWYADTCMQTLDSMCNAAAEKLEMVTHPIESHKQTVCAKGAQAIGDPHTSYNRLHG